MKEQRILIFTGKGGVGKTSVAAAHAVKSAEEGKKTLLISTDMAHNLCDIFEQRLGKEPVSVRECLDVYEIDPEYVMEHDFKHIVTSIINMLPEQMKEDGIEQPDIIPGMDELFSLLYISKIYKQGILHKLYIAFT